MVGEPLLYRISCYIRIGSVIIELHYRHTLKSLLRCGELLGGVEEKKYTHLLDLPNKIESSQNIKGIGTLKESFRREGPYNFVTCQGC